MTYERVYDSSHRHQVLFGWQRDEDSSKCFFVVVELIRNITQSTGRKWEQMAFVCCTISRFERPRRTHTHWIRWFIRFDLALPSANLSNANARLRIHSQVECRKWKSVRTIRVRSSSSYVVVAIHWKLVASSAHRSSEKRRTCHSNA